MTFTGYMLACPDCPTSGAVRAGALEAATWTTLLALALPFVVLGLISAYFQRRDEARARARGR